MTSKILTALALFLTTSAQAEEKAYKKLLWVDLMPQEDVNALYNPPEELFNIPEGGAADDIKSEAYNNLLQQTNDAYLQALSSTNVIDELNEKRIRIPGFVVPVTIEGDKTTEFFIVPYFGACIHYPPPPPNQTIFAVYPKGFGLDEIWDPFDFSGLLTTSVKQNELATAAYHLKIEKVGVYEEY